MKTTLLTILFGVFSAVSTVWACTPDLPAVQGKKAQTIDSKKYALAYRTQPEPVVIGQHFVVELALCAKDGAAAPESVRVDAFMPEHRHGMNYKTKVTSSGAGKYRAEGLMFHMPGRWEYIFEVRAAGTTERMTTSVVLQ
ncbi:MAG: FixH family protein [Burkholderiales bacterium]